MTEFANGFEFRGIYYYQGPDDPTGFFYIPRDLVPEKDPGGKPALILWVSDQGARLQLGTCWEADAGLFESLRKHIAEQFSEFTPASVRLMPAPVSITEAALSVGDGAGKFADVQTVSSSGFPPYHALFNVSLTAEQKTAAAAALQGHQGFLRIVYRGFLPVQVPVTASISGDLRKDMESLGRDATIESCRLQIDMAVAANRLKVERSCPFGVPEDVLRAVENLAREKAAEILLRMARDLRAGFTPGEASLSVKASRAESGDLPIELAADVSAWFADGRGSDHIRVLPATAGVLKTPSSEPVKVKMGFDAAGAPVAFVQVEWGRAKATMRSPSFGPVALTGGDPGGPLTVKTYYADGGPPYESRLLSSGPEGWVLFPKDLGLSKVVLDCTSHKQSGKKAVIRVLYRPFGKGSGDERSVSFRFGDWIDNWYVVTRSEGLDGVLEYDWRETTEDGSIVDHPTAATDQPDLML